MAVMTVAGSDPSGGAGVQADLRVFNRLNLLGLSVISALTAQNTKDVKSVNTVTAGEVKAQLESVTSDIQPLMTKTGMLPSADIIEEVYTFAVSGRLGGLIIDPVLKSSSGVKLAEEGCARKLMQRLAPHCLLMTPNIMEAAMLTDRKVENANEAIEAARALVDAGAGAVCVTGGHWPDAPIDYLFDGEQVYEFTGERMPGGPFHGTGCFFSAAATGFLALGAEMPEALLKAKRLLEQAMKDAISPGAGMKILWLKR